MFPQSFHAYRGKRVDGLSHDPVVKLAMDIFVSLLTFFFIGGLFGFVLELFFRRFVSQKRWVKPGFLAGPFIPLYGFGFAILYAFDAFIPWQSISGMEWLNLLIEIFVLGLALTIIELIAGLVFVKGMKVRLWDYSKQPGNFMGLICPLFSFFWLVGAALYVLLLGEPFIVVGTFFMDHWTVLSYPIGLATGLLLCDFGYSMHVLSKLRAAIKDPRFVASWEKAKLVLRDYYQKLKKKQSFLFPFMNKENKFFEAIEEHMAELKAKGHEALARLEGKRKEGGD